MVWQTFDKAYIITSNAIMLAEPLLAGDQVFAMIGNYPAAPSNAITRDEAGLLYASIFYNVPIAQAYMARVGEHIVNGLVFYDGSTVYKSPVPLTGTITYVNFPTITVV
jgi:hypothetical protein